MPLDGLRFRCRPSSTEERQDVGGSLRDWKDYGRPVIDKTALTGPYVIVLTYPFAGLNEQSSVRSCFRHLSAVHDQLGLRLELQRERVNILKVDRIDKVPTEN